ncbi:hypothetical protein AOCH_005616 [Aspergillus ochraceoroseus]|uniref:Transcription factor SipA3 n=1 Tax=Aspergillus ochraceoroseus TaxID=138278 RepID=A0A0F8X7V7_9EURO|nr:hypothetical protein AOCH_005616 [Aspergillus ochraceoroseus]
MSSQPQTPLPQVGKLVSVVPVGLKEAALDSPTFRATSLHFSDQIEYLERWLDGYARAASKLATEFTALEGIVGAFLSYSTNPLMVSEAALDHDYTLLSMRRCGDSSKDLWNGLIATARKIESLISEPIRAFIQEDLRNFKETRRSLDQTQRQYDSLLARYSSQSKSKEPSALREDAFQLHEARKAYLKASMDFSVQAPQIRNALDRLLVRVSFDQWREFKALHHNNGPTFAKWSQEMDRIKGWVHEMEGSEKLSKRELFTARNQIEEAAEIAARPSHARPEKQGWVNLRILSNKPTRATWVRRWAFLKNGIFGCLVQGHRTGGVEESERIGVLLCSIRPAFQEERRFCFEVKTKSNNIMLQAETQKELMDWIAAFEAAKRKALENPTSGDISVSGKLTVQDPAFAISQPPAPEFAADPADSLTPNVSEEQSTSERSGMLPLPDRDPSAFRNSTDLGSHRRLTLDPESPARDHTSRIIQKLDLHRRSNNTVQPFNSIPGAGGGIASLISASNHAVLSIEHDGPKTVAASTLAPTTLANPPAPTSLSKAAVIVSNDRGIGLGQADKTGGMPSGMMANLWGSWNWGFMNRLDVEHLGQGEEKSQGQESVTSQPNIDSSALKADTNTPSGASGPKPKSPKSRHRQTVSLDGDACKVQRAIIEEESLVLVFRATWNPNDQQEFPGRAYVTTQNLYFYSHYFGLVLTTSVPLELIKEVTAAPGRDCDFLFLHTIPPPGNDTPGRLTVKTFLEPLRLLQKRLNFLIHDATAVEPMGLEAIFKALTKMDTESTARTPSLDSWEDVAAGDKTEDSDDGPGQTTKSDFRSPIYIDKNLDMHSNKGSDIPKFRLPTQPVQYVPQGNLRLAVEKVFDISPKAVFHILFGDKSAVWQLLLYQRRAQDIKQGPWVRNESRHLKRDIQYQIKTPDVFGRTNAKDIFDYQMIDVLNDHLCYVITDKRTPWHLPFRRNFRLVSKIVITFVAKGKSKLSIYTKVEWLWTPYGLQHVIDKQAIGDLEEDAMDLLDLVGDQVRRLGAHSRTKKAITIFGHVGRQSHTSQLSTEQDAKQEPRRPRTQRSLFQLLHETFFSFLESAISSVMIWLFALLRWGWKTTKANRVILALLLCSVVLNGLFSSRATIDWWHERNVGKFMSRIGVHPDHVMSKALYMRDIDEAIANLTIGQTSDNVSDCFYTFQQQTIRDSTTPSYLGMSTRKDWVARSAAKRIQQTRERLSVYRHNLLVAIRVVNSIEKEVLQNEWERWLRQELRRCHQVEDLIERKEEHERRSEGQEDQVANGVFTVLTDDVKQWYETYCSSCQKEQEQLDTNIHA